MTDGVCFCTAADARYFLGAVALVNSLRLVGHEEPIFVLDCGLEPTQAAVLAREASLVPASGQLHPLYAKGAFARSLDAQVAVHLDADVIVTRPFEPLIELAQQGRIVAFEDQFSDRHFSEWELLGLGYPRRQPYVSAGHLITPQNHRHRLFELVDDGLSRVKIDYTLLDDGVPEDPFYYADMDVLNAVLATSFSRDALAILDFTLAPHTHAFGNLQTADSNTLRCRFPDATEPFLLHHTRAKPWLGPTRLNAYSRLLPRLWLDSDLPIQLRPADVPRQFRPASGARVERARVFVSSRARGRIGLRRSLTDRRRQRRRRRLAQQYVIVADSPD